MTRCLWFLAESTFIFLPLSILFVQDHLVYEVEKMVAVAVEWWQFAEEWVKVDNKWVYQ
jgi:hypothetical protein